MLIISPEHCDSVMLSDTVEVDFSASQGAIAFDPHAVPDLYAHCILQLPVIWRQLGQLLPDNAWIVHASQSPLAWSMVLVNNAEMQQLNSAFRQKDSATDVLTFSLLEDEKTDELGHASVRLPQVNLGEAYVSYEWAKAACIGEKPQKDKKLDPVSLYVIERLVHGCLHLMGVHHDTMPAYHQVVAIQQKVLASLV